MTKAETLNIMEILQVSYPKFYQNTASNELKKAVTIWAEMFQNDDVEVVKAAVKNLISMLEFPPTIADIKKEINKLVQAANGELTGVDEWNMIRKAIKNSTYNSKEEFDKLPTVAKRFVGSPQQLRDWGIMSDFNEGVIRGQFLKQYDSLKEREQYQKILSQNPRLKSIMDKIPLLSDKLLEEKGTA